jgi:transposase-like protein
MKNPTNHEPALLALKNAFAEFRVKSVPRAKIPEELRQSVVAAIDSGVSTHRITKTLRVSNSQLKSWKKIPSANQGSMGKATQVRILDVIPSPPAHLSSNNLRVTYEAGRLVLEFSI